MNMTSGALWSSCIRTLSPLSSICSLTSAPSETETEKMMETTNKNALEEQIKKCLEKLGRADEFEIDYQVAPIRNTVPQPHVVSLFLTAFVIEKLIKHKDVIDIFGSDEDIYLCIHQQVKKFLTT